MASGCSLPTAQPQAERVPDNLQVSWPLELKDELSLTHRDLGLVRVCGLLSFQQAKCGWLAVDL
jgi:hypothetical protein